MNRFDPNLPPQVKKYLTESERGIIFATINENIENGKPKKGVVVRLAESLNVDRTTVVRIWRKGVDSVLNGPEAPTISSVPVLSLQMKGACGRKRKACDLSRMNEIPLRNRTNIRSLSAALSIAKSTVHRHVKEGDIRAHSNAIKPFLTDANKKSRLSFCLSMLNRNNINVNPTFYDMYNIIHIDEKWFYMTKESERYYLLPGEPDPIRTCKSKRFIEKVMFLAVVARPRFDAQHNCTFDGKIGIFPFTYEEPAKRSSKHDTVGTIVTKPINSVTKEVYRACLLEKVLPAIRDRWPRVEGVNRIYIQQDNAKPHIGVDDPDFIARACGDGFEINLMFQPPNSPDLNVLDLGYFRSIQTLQHQEAPKTVNQLLDAVVKSFADLNHNTLDKVYLSLQACMIETLKVFGGNNYKLPHIGKNHLELNGNLPCTLSCDIDIVNQAEIYLQQP